MTPTDRSGDRPDDPLSQDPPSDDPSSHDPLIHSAREHLAHGPFTLRLAGDEVSEIAVDGVVLVETLRPALRDPQWGTLDPEVLEVRQERRGETLVRTLDARYPGCPAARARTVLEIGPQELRLRWELVAQEEILTNRAGLTVMLPRAMAGNDLEVLTVRGESRPARLPVLVSPFQPLFDVRELGLEHRGLRATLRLEGDTFEMEDQRNWCDASFKLYSRPLAAPFPYSIAAGERVRQEVILRPTGRVPAAAVGSPADGSAAPREPSATPDAAAPDAAMSDAAASVVHDLAALLDRAQPCALPRISLGATTSFSDALRPGARTVSALRGLPGLDALVIEVADGFPRERILRSAAEEARALGLDADLRIITTEATGAAELTALLAEASRAGLRVRRAGIVDAAAHVTTAPLLRALRQATAGSGVELVAGARTHFTELNRMIRTIPADADLLGFAHTPQMHQRETWHVVESLACIPDVIASARALRPAARLQLGPITLPPRVNAVATEPALVDRWDEHGYGAHLTPDADDPRQRTPLAGAWAACALLAAAAGGVDSVILAEAAGPRGILDADADADAGTEPATRPAVGRDLPPLARVLRELAGGPREALVLTDVAGSGTALCRRGERLLLANAREDPWRLRRPDGEVLEVAPASVLLASVPTGDPPRSPGSAAASGPVSTDPAAW